MHLIGVGLVVLGIIAIAMADDSGGFGAALELSDADDGPVLKLAMKTHLSTSASEATVVDAVLPPGADA